MADKRKFILGTLSNLFQLGKSLAISFVNNSGVLEIKNKAQSAFAVLRALSLNSTASPSDNDIATFLDLKQNDPLIEFEIDGAGSPPSPGDNTNKFGYCKSTGGAFTDKRVYFDNGTAFEWVRHIKTFRTSAGGTFTALSPKFSYGWDNGDWGAVGDGAGGNTGAVKILTMPFSHGDTTISSTVTFAIGTKIHGWDINKSEVFNGTNPTLSGKVDGTTDLAIFATAESDLSDLILDSSDTAITVESGNEGLVVLTLSDGSSTTGEGEVSIYYSPTQTV